MTIAMPWEPDCPELELIDGRMVNHWITDSLAACLRLTTFPVLSGLCDFIQFIGPAGSLAMANAMQPIHATLAVNCD